jgi:hypothetical protein
MGLAPAIGKGGGEPLADNPFRHTLVRIVAHKMMYGGTR